MSELRNRMTESLKLAGLSAGTSKKYLRAVQQLAAYYMVPPDQLSERQVQDYLLYVRDTLEVAKGTWTPMYHGLKHFFVNTLAYDWALFTKKKFACRSRNDFRMSVATPTVVASSPRWRTLFIAVALP